MVPRPIRSDFIPPNSTIDNPVCLLDSIVVRSGGSPRRCKKATGAERWSQSDESAGNEPFRDSIRRWLEPTESIRRRRTDCHAPGLSPVQRPDREFLGGDANRCCNRGAERRSNARRRRRWGRLEIRCEVASDSSVEAAGTAGRRTDSIHRVVRGGHRNTPVGSTRSTGACGSTWCISPRRADRTRTVENRTRTATDRCPERTPIQKPRRPGRRRHKPGTDGET